MTIYFVFDDSHKGFPITFTTCRSAFYSVLIMWCSMVGGRCSMQILEFFITKDLHFFCLLLVPLFHSPKGPPKRNVGNCKCNQECVGQTCRFHSRHGARVAIT